MAFNPTKEQDNAIKAKGNILVSAAAGSGKTAVLVERVIGKLCDKQNGISADKLLIVTFTNAAAAEMRSRIEKRLEEVISQNPHDPTLIMQKHLLGSAKICTIDSFCIDLVRENFDKLGVSPDFKIGDAGLLKNIDDAVLSEIIGRYLAEKDEVFLELLDIIGAEHDERNFVEFITEIYNYSRQLPFPKVWFKALSADYNNGVFDSNNRWYQYAFSEAKSVIEESIQSLANALDLLWVNETAANKFLPTFKEAATKLNELLEACNTNDWDIFYNALKEFSLPSLPIVRGLSGIYEVTAAKEIYKHISKKALEGLGKLFYENSEFINLQFSKLNLPIKLLSEILIEYDQKLFEAYTENNTFTFHNTEHLALRLLCEDADGEIKIREDAIELLNRFSEVMVDEYQDTNDLQDILFHVLSNREEHLFAVGDVKQSIYGFRGANPKNFLNKKNNCALVDEVDEIKPRKIILGKNFRTKPQVCEFINFVFSTIMNENTGDIVYTDEEKLIPAAEYPPLEEVSSEICLINTKGSEDGDIKIEAREIAKYIKQTMASGEVIRQDEHTLRKAEYRDFTILHRSAGKKAPLIAEELKMQGIPVTYSIEDFAGSMEVTVLLNLLSVIDNPQSDVELLSVMMSSLFGFTAEEMAKIRIAKRKESLYSAVVNSANNGNEKLKNFLKELEKYRLLSVINPLSGFINILLEQTGFLQLVTAMNDGVRRRNNLLLLVNYAAEYSENQNGGLGSFVRYIKKQSESGIKAAGTVTGGNSVKIMSIHASKGLQFPVCIVSGLSGDFNDSETRDHTVYTTDFGIGFKYYDEVDKTRYTTISREAVLNKIRAERLCEELRLLYVALTRTQDRLFMTVSMSDVYKKCEELKTMLISADSKITSSIFARTKRYSDWLILSLLLHPEGTELRAGGGSLMLRGNGSKVKIIVKDYDALPDISTSDTNTETVTDEALTEKIRQNIAYEYPFEEILKIESKASASRLAGSADDMKYAFTSKPSFMSDGGITSAERGTAMHKVIEFFDFEKCDAVEQELERLYEWQYISEREYNSVNIEKLKAFFESDVFGRIKKSDTVKREMRFLTEVDATSIVPTLDERFKDEKIVVQGAVDICFVENEEVVILDFKTDRVEDDAALKQAYAEQLNIYALACEKIFGLPIKQKIIYSFALSKEIEI